jgi:hypothetical protein
MLKMMTRIKRHGVTVEVPGFHPIKAFRLYRVGRRAQANDVAIQQLISAAEAAGYNVTTRKL